MSHRTLPRLTALCVLAGCAAGASAGAGSQEYERVTNRSAVAAAIRDSVAAVLQRAQRDSAFPGAIAIVGRRDGEIAEVSVGRIDWSAAAPVPDRHTLWDMASLTKVMATTSAMMALVDLGRLDLDAPVQRYLPAWTGPNKARVTVRHLITHTSGLPSFRPYDRVTHDADSMHVLMFGTPLDSMPGRVMIYSDIGAYLAGRVVEALSGMSLDRFAAQQVFVPLGMTDTWFNPPASLRTRIAPTERDSARADVDGLVRGRVHDERAYYLGGVSAHAGLFSSAHDASRFARAMLRGGELDGTRVFADSTVRQFTSYDDATFSNRAIGWQKPTAPGTRFGDPSPTWAGSRASSSAFGHTGFTGTSLLVDPAYDIYIVLLTNRVNPTRANTRISGVRRALTDAVIGALDGSRSAER